ncbi:MAG: hypothetical protein P9L99_09780 [Candidatus Lernaella stagnicola]|nr:hypothetical protein [Candidatus Lernaella stagnicola]
MSAPKASYSPERDRRKAIRYGMIALVVIALLAVVSIFMQQKKKTREAQVLAAGDVLFRAGLNGDCPAFAKAADHYLAAMKMHLQSKQLAFQAGVSQRLAALCRRDLTTSIATRRIVVDSGEFSNEDIKELVLALLASGQADQAREVLSMAVADPFFQRLTVWLDRLSDED